MSGGGGSSERMPGRRIDRKLEIEKLHEEGFRIDGESATDLIHAIRVMSELPLGVLLRQGEYLGFEGTEDRDRAILEAVRLACLRRDSKTRTVLQANLGRNLRSLAVVAGIPLVSSPVIDTTR